MCAKYMFFVFGLGLLVCANVCAMQQASRRMSTVALEARMMPVGAATRIAPSCKRLTNCACESLIALNNEKKRKRMRNWADSVANVVMSKELVLVSGFITAIGIVVYAASKSPDSHASKNDKSSGYGAPDDPFDHGEYFGILRY